MYVKFSELKLVLIITFAKHETKNDAPRQLGSMYHTDT